MHYLAFDKSWFERHQTKLLRLLNSPLTRRWFRRVLRIESDRIIVQILPTSYTVFLDYKDGRVELQADFRTHAKYAKRLYHAFKPLWWAMHLWDLIADSLLSELSFGFSTLTAYPDAGSGVTTVDGQVGQTGTTDFATKRAAAGSSANTAGTAANATINSSTISNNYTNLQRCICTFDTSSLTTAAIISSAVFSVQGSSKSNGLGSFDLHVAGAAPASNNTLVASDYAQVQTTSFGSIAYASYSIVAYNDISLNALGISNISLTGISRFSQQLSCDINNSAPTWASSASSSLAFVTADAAGGTSTAPKLVVTYTIPVASTAPVSSTPDYTMRLINNVTSY